MGKLIYLLNMSLDGFVADVDGDLEWSTVDVELHAWFNEQTRTLDASLYGRRMYELMHPYWSTAEDDPDASPVEREFSRVWKRMPKVVFSTTLTSVEGNSRLVSGDVGERLAELRAEFPGDLDVSGPTLASAFLERGLVDEVSVVVHPVLLGAGRPLVTALSQRVPLRLLETFSFGSGVTVLRYAVERP